MARPMPRDAPVTMATFSLRDREGVGICGTVLAEIEDLANTPAETRSLRRTSLIGPLRRTSLIGRHHQKENAMLRRVWRPGKLGRSVLRPCTELDDGEGLAEVFD